MATEMQCRRCNGSKQVTVTDAKTGEKKLVSCPVCGGTGMMKSCGIITK